MLAAYRGLRQLHGLKHNNNDPATGWIRTMTNRTENGKSLKLEKKLKNEHNWKHLARWNGEGFYDLRTDDIGDVPVRLFLTPGLLKATEDIIYRQIVNATRFPGVKLVAITPDVHYGYGVPVGCVILTDPDEGAVAMGPVGFDIGCGMMSAKSQRPDRAATPRIEARVQPRGDEARGPGRRRQERQARQLSIATNSMSSFAAAPSTTSRSTARRSIAAAPSVIVCRSTMTGSRRLAERASPSAGSLSWARLAAATTSSSCSVAKRPGRYSSRCTPARAASVTGSRLTTSRWRGTRSPR